MELDWTTFTLEIINFLVLIWILKRFLYQPVLNVIAKRRDDIEKTLVDARRIEAESNKLKLHSEQNLAKWEVEKEAAQASLLKEIATIREKKMAELNDQLKQETNRRRVLEEREQDECERKIMEQAIVQGAAFCSKLLTRLASAELETVLYRLLVEDLRHLSEAETRDVTQAAAAPGLQIKVQSAFSLDSGKRTELSRLFAEVTGRTLPLEYQLNPELIAGFYIDIGPWILHANLRDELKFFSRAGQRAG